MDFHCKLNQFSKYLQDNFYIVNNVIKQSPIDGLHMTDFDQLTILDVVFPIPRDKYMSAVFNGTGNDGECVVQFICQEYSMMRGDYELELEYGNKIATILRDVKSLLTGDSITLNFEKQTAFPKVYRDNFSQNGKVRTVYTEEYLIKF